MSLVIEVTRGDTVESVHRVSVAVADADGRLRLAHGDTGHLVYPRSALKPIQALATELAGGFAQFGLGAAEIALHCASHNGEARHIEGVGAWLARLGLDESALQCGPQTPMWAMRDMQRAHQAPPPSALANNCSGKHAGFLTAALHGGHDIADYVRPEHPVQRAVRALLARLSDTAEAAFITSTDGCSAPVHALPLHRFATALARLADPSGLDRDTADGARRVVAAMRAEPWLVAGTHRPDTLLMEEPEFTGIAKVGAEGVYGLALPDAGLGIAVKVEDGADRAAAVAACAVLAELEMLSEQALTRLSRVARPQIHNWAGLRIGEIRVARQN